MRHVHKQKAGAGRHKEQWCGRTPSRDGRDRGEEGLGWSLGTTRMPCVQSSCTAGVLTHGPYEYDRGDDGRAELILRHGGPATCHRRHQHRSEFGHAAGPPCMQVSDH